MGNRRQSLGQVQSNPIKIEILSDDEDETKTTKRAVAPAPTVSSAGITNAAPATELSSVQLFGTEISYKRSDKKTLFNTRALLELLRGLVPFGLPTNQLFFSDQVPKQLECLRSPLISWASLKLTLRGLLFDLALTDLLVHYRPFGRSHDVQVERKIFSLEGCLKLDDKQDIGFTVNDGKVFLRHEQFKTVTESRKETMKDVNVVLEERNISPENAFLKVGSDLEYNFVLLAVLQLTVTSSKLGAVLRHLEKQINCLGEKRHSFETEMDQTVQMINRQCITQQACLLDQAESELDIKPDPSAINKSLDGILELVPPGETASEVKGEAAMVVEEKPEPVGRSAEEEIVRPSLKRTYKECSNTQCGRTYHFILSCCDLDHVLTLGQHRIPYMYHGGQIYLEKCSAFEAIGKTSVIRCSNYKKVDRLLNDNGLDPVAEFLQHEAGYQRKRKKRNKSTTAITRNRRNHISLAALRVLVDNNFVATSNQPLLKATLDQFAVKSSVPDCRRRLGPVAAAAAGAAAAGHSSAADSSYSACEATEGEEEEEEGIEDVEDDDTILEVNLADLKAEDEQSSSGVESNLESSPEPPPLSAGGDGEEAAVTGSDGQPVKVKVEDKGKQPRSLRLLDTEVPYRILNNTVFLKKNFVFKIFQLKGAPRKMHDSLEQLLSDAGHALDKAFLYEGRLSNYVSTDAIRSVVSSSLLVEPVISPDLLLSELARVESDTEALTTIKQLNLKTLGDIKYQIQDGRLYFDTLKLMRLADVQLSLVNNSPSKANFFVKKLLQDRGVNIASCFLKQRNSKYAFINLRSALILLQYAHETEHKERALKLKKELLIAANKKELLRKPSDGAGGCGLNYLKIANHIPNLKYKIKAGNMYFHRKTIFECIGLETVIYGSKKGFLPINMVITDLGFDFSQVYLSNQQEVFAYISAPSVLLLLESLDPIMVLLDRKQDFLANLLHAIEFSVCSMLGSHGSMLVENHKVPWLSHSGRLFLDRNTVFSLSRLSTLSEWAEQLVKGGVAEVEEHVAEKGLELERDFVARGTDLTAFIGLHALLALFAQDCDSTRPRESHSLLLRDTLSAIAIQEPKLRSHIRMSHFRLSLVTRIITEYLRSLQENGGGLELDTEQEESGLELDHSDEEGARKNQGVDGRETPAPPTAAPPASPVEAADDAEESESAAEEGDMEQLRRELVSLVGGGGSIGDWELVTSEPVTQLSVRPGYGASRKLSFLQPDVAAILKYDLYVSADSLQLLINQQMINGELIDKIVSKSREEGGLSLLYQLLSLRPCFGSFNPELVETVGQSAQQLSAKNLILDYNFIGSSSHGRTYAGTVRSSNCTFVAQSRVADRCAACNCLDDLVINRSLLSGEIQSSLLNNPTAKNLDDVEDKESGTAGRKGSAHNPSHQSVWKLDTTDQKGCSFLCPQIQTFNSSLPHAFVGSAQATTIVNHRVEISDALDLKVELCGRAVRREFPQFAEDRQLGPLLDKVAAMRLCIGYPAPRLGDQARFILNHQGRLVPEMRKLFRHFTVDEEFSYRCGENEEKGTIRSINCTVEAEVGSDICSSCRGLQQPMEFL